ATVGGVDGGISGIVTLTATADDGSGSGVAKVRFERAPTGSANWTTIGTDVEPPFESTFDSRAVPNGLYHFRAIVTDVAGNVGKSSLARGVSVSNPQRSDYTQFSITNFVVPAKNVTLLGEVAGSPENETWALGRTNAAPASVDGTRLPYTAEGDSQVVLL